MPSGVTTVDLLFQERDYVRQTSIRCQNYYAAREPLKNSEQLLTLPRLLGEHLHSDELVLTTPPHQTAKISMPLILA